MNGYSNIHVGAVSSGTPQATNAQQQIMMAQIQKAIEGVVDVKVGALSKSIEEVSSRTIQAEKYISMIANKMAEDSESKKGPLFSPDELRVITLFQSGILSREEVRQILFGESSPPSDESPKKTRKKKDTTSEVSDETAGQ